MGSVSFGNFYTKPLLESFASVVKDTKTWDSSLGSFLKNVSNTQANLNIHNHYKDTPNFLNLKSAVEVICNKGSERLENNIAALEKIITSVNNKSAAALNVRSKMVEGKAEVFLTEHRNIILKNGTAKAISMLGDLGINVTDGRTVEKNDFIKEANKSLASHQAALADFKQLSDWNSTALEKFVRAGKTMG